MAVSERLTISFADAKRDIQGVTVAGAGTLLRIGAELASATESLIEHTGEPWRIAASGSFELALASWGRGAAMDELGALAWPATAVGTVAGQHVEGPAMVARAPGEPADFALERSIAVLFEDAPLAVALAATRPRGAGAHGEEELTAIVFRGEPLEPARILKPRLSSTYDPDGILTHVGIELWETEETEFALRIGGEVVATGELTGRDGHTHRVALIDWHHDGRRALGSYTITTAGT